MMESTSKFCILYDNFPNDRLLFFSYLEVYFYVMKITSSKVYFSSKKGVSINLNNNFFLKFSVIPNRFSV